MSFDLERIADDNLHLHMRWVQERTPGMRVVDGDDLLVVDSGLGADTFNFVSRARLHPERAHARIAEAVDHFERAGRPFSWWVGLTDRPEGLGRLLEAAGLRPAESEVAMAVRLDALKPSPTSPDGLRIERVRTRDRLEDYAALLARLWDPPDENVRIFYRRAAPVLLAEASPLRLYLGSLDTTPVATAEMTMSADAAGLYNISTATSARGRGIGSAMTTFPLLEARGNGKRFGILQAAAGALGVYLRVGFEAIGRYTEYQR